MASELELVDIIKTLLDLGLSAILLYMLWTLWKDKKEDKKRSSEIIASKDVYIREINKEVLSVVKENTKTQEQLRASVEQNTKATETLTNRIYEAIKQ